MAGDRPTRLGPLPLVHALVATLHQGGVAATLGAWPLLASWVVIHQKSPWLPIAGFLLLSVVDAATTLTAVRAARRRQAGLRGRSRVAIAGLAHLLYLTAVQAPLGVLVYGASRAVASGYSFTFGLDEAVLALSDDWSWALRVSGAVAAVLTLVDLGARLSLWFLLPGRFRSRFWLLVDTALLGAFVWVTRNLPLEPASEELAALREPVARLAVTTLFGTRVFARMLPVLMGAFERLGFLPLVATRHLRAKKSGFLAAIGGLSIGAVAVSTCMLVAVLSVMGGFRNDLKEKILGNHAHVLIDRDEGGTFEGWGPVLTAARQVPGVVAATPFVEGEVMLTSASNRAGAELRGIEPDSLTETTRIEEYLQKGRGRLDYLLHPERLLDLPPEERETILPLTLDLDGEGDEEGGLVREIERELRREPEPPRGPPAPEQPAPEQPAPEQPAPEQPAPEDPLAGVLREERIGDGDREVLPGIVLGKELARTLRVFVGDDVDVVSPMGELGPAGPVPKARRFRVAGVFYSGMYEYDMKLVYVLLPDAQRFLNTGDAISGIELKVADVDRAPEVARSVGATLEELDRTELRVRDWQQTNRSLFGALQREKLAMSITLGIAVLIAGFCVFGTLTLMVQEKGREVGILFAMGATPGAIVGIFMLEGLLIGLYGASIGIGLGYVATFAFEHFGIRLNPEVYYIDRLPVHIDPTEFALVGVAALTMCVVATIFPALLASRTQPVEAIRYQ